MLYPLVIVMVALSVMSSLPSSMAQGRQELIEANGHAVIRFTDKTRVRGRATVSIWGTRYGYDIQVIVAGNIVAQWNRDLEDFDVQRDDSPDSLITRITSYDHAEYGSITVRLVHTRVMIAHGAGGLIRSLLFVGGPIDYQITIV